MKTFIQSHHARLEESSEADYVCFNVPLFIRLLEWAREDAKTDMDLHQVAEKAVSLCKKTETLSMEHYETLIK